MKLRKYSAVELLITLVLFFILGPFVDQLEHGEFFISCLVALVLVAALRAVGGRRRTLVIATVLALFVVIARGIAHFRPDLTSAAFGLLAAIAFNGFVITNLIRFVLRARRVDTEVLCAAISGYLLMGLAWTAAYMFVAREQREAFGFSTAPAGHSMTPYEAFYFSFVTLATVGYGDITPASSAARMLAVLEAITGLFYVTVLIARLVALFSVRPPEELGSDEEF